MKYIALGFLFVILGIVLFIISIKGNFGYMGGAGIGSLGGAFIGLGYLMIKGHLNS